MPLLSLCDLPYSNNPLPVMVHRAQVASKATRSTTQRDSFDDFVQLVKQRKLNVSK